MIKLPNIKTLSIIGESRCSVVYEAYYEITKSKVALKIIYKKPSLTKIKSPAERELETLKIIKHPNIIGFYDYFEINNSGFFVLEYFRGSTLEKLVSTNFKQPNDMIINNKIIKSYLKQIIGGLKYLHSQNVYHCDLKPENILVNGKEIRIIDFGCSLISDKPVQSTQLMYWGTPGYSPPEILNFENMVSLDDVDIWALACDIYFIYKNSAPFTGQNNYDIFQKVKKIIYDKKGLPEWVSSILNLKFIENPSDRLKLIDIENIINELSD
ncbi:CBL-interacting protein kinase 2 [Dictyocoela muelleri]|nr:CBL-interacting protein kinase 2 [Dictyocoela muelleri]